MPYKNKIRNFLTLLAVLLISFQFISWIGMESLYKNGEEHPMSDIQDFIVDDNGDIIVNEVFYSVIQVYDKNGKFLTSWKPKVNGHGFKIFLGENKLLKIARSKNDIEQYIYTFKGDFIQKENFVISQNDSSNCKNYKIVGGVFFPKIIKLVKNQEKIIIKQNFIMNMLKAPLPFFGTGIIAFLIICINSTLKKIKGIKK